MPQLFTPPFQTTFDANGAPISGAKLAFYVTGTTVPAQVYADADLAVSLGSVLTADAAGRFPPIYMNSAIVYRVIVSDAGGTPIRDVDPVGDSLLPSLAAPSGASLVGFAQSGGGAVAQNLLNKTRRDTPVSIEDFGGSPGAADNVAALTAAITELKARGGGVLQLQGGRNYNLASASLATAIVGGSNIAIEGQGSSLTVTGTAQTDAIFDFSGCSNWSMAAVILIGNSKATGYNNGAAIRYYLKAPGTADIGNVTLDIEMRNFQAPYWLDIENDNTTYAIRNIRGVVRFTSLAGNSLDPNNLSVNSSAVCLNGFAGDVRDFDLRVYGDAAYIKTGIILYNKCKNGVIGGSVANAGVYGAGNDKGAYSFQVYGEPADLQNVTIYPTATGPRSTGVYIASGKNIAIINPQISGQFDTTTGTLPKGAIASGGTTDLSIFGGDLTGNYIDLTLVPKIGVLNWNVRVVGLKTAGSTMNAVRLSYVAGSDARGVCFEGCQIAGSGPVVFSVQNSMTARVDDVTFTGGYIRLDAGAGRAADLYVDSGSAAKGYRFANTKIIGSFYARDQTGSLTFSDVEFEGEKPAGQALVTILNCADLRMDDYTIRGVNAGFGLDTSGSRGVTSGARFVGTPNRVLNNNSLGAVKPTFEGGPLDVVQNLGGSAFTAQGVAPNKYTIPEWVCETAAVWNDRRCLTGT